jgi:hypothetical protein
MALSFSVAYFYQLQIRPRSDSEQALVSEVGNRELIGPSHLLFPYLSSPHGGDKLFLNKTSEQKDFFGKGSRIFEKTKKLKRRYL